MASNKRRSPAARASKLSAATNEHRNTKSGRAKMAASSFAIPETRSYRIDDLPHARNALSRVAQNGTPAEQAQVAKAVAAKYPSLRNSPFVAAHTGRSSGS